MALSLHPVTCGLVTRSVNVPTTLIVSSASRFLGGHRSFATKPILDDLYNRSSRNRNARSCFKKRNTKFESEKFNDPNDQSWLRILRPGMSSVSFDMYMSEKGRRIQLDLLNEGMSVDLKMPGLKKKDMRACAEDNALFIQGKPHKECDLTNNNSSDIKEEKYGIITNIIAHEIISSFRDIDNKHSWAYNDMFYDRSILGRGLCPLIATLSAIDSFTIYKRERTSDHLLISMRMPGIEKMKLTTHGLRVSLDMYRMKREDVKVFFDYDTLFVEGKTNEEHYITGIHLPEGLYKKHNMIKREMIISNWHNPIFCATIACGVKMELSSEIKDQLKPKLNIITSKEIYQDFNLD